MESRRKIMVVSGPRSRPSWLATAALSLLLTGICSLAAAGQATLAWTPNTESDLAGYNVYYAVSGASYDQFVDAKTQTSATISGLAEGVTYQFAVTAYNTAGVESDFSTAVSYTVPTSGSGGTGTGSDSGQSAYDLLLSLQADRSNPVSLAGQTVSGPIYVFTGPDSGVYRVSFYLDDPTCSGPVYLFEKYAPFDFATGSTNAANAFDTSTLGDGSHNITAVMNMTDGTTTTLTADFTVQNHAAPVVTIPAVSGIVRAGTNPTNAGSVEFTVAFDESVSGVDPTDFALTTTGDLSGAAIGATVGTGSTYTVSVTTGTGSGTLRLDLVDNDSIVNASGSPLGGSGSGNGSYASGETYSLDKTAPVVSVGTTKTTDSTPALAGGVDDAAATVSVQVAGRTYTAQNNGDGTWTLADNTLSELTVGTYDVAVAATDAVGNTGLDATSNELVVEAVLPAYQLLLSLQNDRSTPVPLAGQTVSGPIYVFTGPDSGVYRVSFYLNDPTCSGPVHQFEKYAPFDFATGSTDTADPFDTSTLANGSHNITAVMNMTDGSKLTLSADFTVLNAVPNSAPVAGDDTAATQVGTPVTIAVLANDRDTDNDSLAVTSLIQGTHGQVADNGQEITYTPAAGFVGTDTFTYTVSDGKGGSATATVTVTVCQAPAITSTPGTEALVGETYVYDLTVTGFPTPTVSLANGPDGMSLDAQSGHLQWSPLAAGSFTVTLAVQNEAGSCSQEFVIVVLDPTILPDLPTTATRGDAAMTWSLALDIEAAAATGQLHISQATTAGDNFDAGLDEAAAGLPAYLEGAASNPQLATDVRSSYSKRVNWILAVASDTPAGAILRWNRDELPEQASLTINELDANGAIVPETETDMAVASELTLGSAGSRYRISYISQAVTYETIDIKAGWNLIAFTLQGEDDRVETVFAGLNDGPVWKYNAATGSYEAASAIQPGLGYWFYSAEETLLVHVGTPATSGQVNLSRGWNLVGALGTCPVPANSALIADAIWTLDLATGEYQNATCLEAGAGYWIFASEDTNIVLK